MSRLRWRSVSTGSLAMLAFLGLLACTSGRSAGCPGNVACACEDDSVCDGVTRCHEGICKAPTATDAAVSDRDASTKQPPKDAAPAKDAGPDKAAPATDDPPGELDGGTKGDASTVKGTDAGTLDGGEVDEDAGHKDATVAEEDAGPIADAGQAVLTFIHDDTAQSGLTTAEINALTSPTDPLVCTLLYPYSGTRFPLGVASPPIMWEGDSDAAHVSVGYAGQDHVAYAFAQEASSPGELTLPKDVWDAIAELSRGADLVLTLNTRLGDTFSQCELRLSIATGPFVGAVYYNTYNAVGAITPGNGAVLRLSANRARDEIALQYKQASVPVTGPCISCHTVSADGSTVVAATHSHAPFAQQFEGFAYGTNTTLDPALGVPLVDAVFGALTPDGTRVLTIGNPDCTGGADSFPRTPNNFPFVEGPTRARLLSTATGQDLQASGLDDSMYMWMPQFSPAGDKVVFNHARPDGSGGTARRDLAIMDFDTASNTFSNLRTIVSGIGPSPSLNYSPVGAGAGPIPNGKNDCATTDSSRVGALPSGACSGPCYPAFPTFTPDGNAVVFAMISQPDFASSIPGRSKPALGELWHVVIEPDATPVQLANINATLADSDRQHEYSPSVFPAAIGGNFWVTWTSRRAFGHRDTGSQGVANEDPLRKRLWMAALRPSIPGAGDITDPSRPGFYLQGQSSGGGHNATAVLSACLSGGAECQLGMECCGGHCDSASPVAVGRCTDTSPACSPIGDQCLLEVDCCEPSGAGDAPLSCIAGYCADLRMAEVLPEL